MIEAIERQEQDEAGAGVEFPGSLALLIDQQWNWQENQALTRRVKASRLRGGACVEDINYRAERGLNRVPPWVDPRVPVVKNHEHISCSDPPVSGRVTWLRHWRRKPAGTAMRLLHPSRGAVPRSEPGTSRWQSWAPAETPETGSTFW